MKSCYVSEVHIGHLFLRPRTRPLACFMTFWTHDQPELFSSCIISSNLIFIEFYVSSNSKELRGLPETDNIPNFYSALSLTTELHFLQQLQRAILCCLKNSQIRHCGLLTLMSIEVVFIEITMLTYVCKRIRIFFARHCIEYTACSKCKFVVFHISTNIIFLLLLLSLYSFSLLSSNNTSSAFIVSLQQQKHHVVSQVPMVQMRLILGWRCHLIPFLNK